MGLLLILAAAGWVSRPSSAQDTPHAFTFSSRAYVKLNSYSRIYLQGKNEWQLARDRRSWGGSAALDFLLKPILRPIIKSPDIARSDYLLVRMGATYNRKWGDRKGDQEEGFLSFLSRLPLPHNWEVADRNRVDLRSKAEFSWRYRNRPEVDWSWQRAGWVVQPFSESEFFYDSRYSQIERVKWRSGIDISTGRSIQWEPSFTRRFDEKPQGGHDYNSYRLAIYLYFQ